MLILKDFYYFRHGETDWNLEFRGMGQQDVPLNRNGERQAAQAVNLLANEPIKLICHSPLRRAKDTARIISERLAIPMREIVELTECCWGEKEGQVKGKWTEDWIAGKAIPGAESYEEFLSRAMVGINTALSETGPVLIVSHGGVFWGVQKFAQLGNQYDLGNCIPVFLRAPPSNHLPWGVTVIDMD